MSRASAPLHALHQQGQRALEAGQYPQALELLHQAAQKTTARDNDYHPVLRDLRTAALNLNLHRAALTVDWYLGDSRGEAQLLDRVPAYDRARTLQAWAERSEGDTAAQRYQQAAKVFEQAGTVAHAAICHEHAGDWSSAVKLWSRLADALARSGADRYAAGLARFNVSRCRAQLDDAQGSHQALVNAVHLLEEAADHFERIGQRERSFDSYQVLIAVGRQSDQFEHMLEGYVNAIRILRQDALRYYALQSYEDVLREAQERAEFTAGASLAQEMAGYAASESMHSIANYAVGKQAAMWREVARASLQRGAPAEIAENAILAAIVALAKQGQFAEVGTLYAELGQLDLEPARQKHYSRASQRYQGVSNQPLDASPLPAHLRQDTEFPDVWHVDLVEHEQAGSASAACGDVVLQPDSWSDSTRRRAMLARLVALDIDAAQGSATAAQLVRLAQTLSQVELYTILSPLEALYRSPTSEVRLAVIQALERFMYKRSFVTVRGALSDDTAGVRQQAYRTVEALRFPHAFEPLARIVRESNDARARTAALSAIGRIDTADAAELLLGVFQHEGQKERQAAADALKRARGSTFFDAAKQAFPTLPKDAQRAIREVFQARGESL